MVRQSAGAVSPHAVRLRHRRISSSIIWIPAAGPWEWKDDELLEERSAGGRYTAAQVAATRAEGQRIATALDAGRQWWSADWATWEPNPSWPTP